MKRPRHRQLCARSPSPTRRNSASTGSTRRHRSKKWFDLDNAASESLWWPPQARLWILSRLGNRCWTLKRFDRNTASKPLAFRTSEGARFATWEIPAGAEVAFRWNSFVAVSECATFGKTISMKQLSSIVLEHIMLPSVREPGLLIQRTYGAPSSTSAAVASYRLLAWPFGTPFRIEALSKLLSTDIDHCQMRAHADGQAKLDALRERRGDRGYCTNCCGCFIRNAGHPPRTYGKPTVRLTGIHLPNYTGTHMRHETL